MRAVVVMFDSLNRRLLPPYGARDIHAPNFDRLAARTVTFDTCYAGSMPCMPARRELHTGRYNFLHRSWGPLEPFDDSVPEMLKNAGVYTHLATDHQHYWEDGGATYHSRYSTFEFFRGQEGDPWKGHVEDVEHEPSLNICTPLTRQDWINRRYLTDERDHPQARTFDAGIEFIQTNKSADNWFLQIECFDPHEPFFTYDAYRSFYPENYRGPHFDWPSYRRVVETPEQATHARREYLALLSMCDRSLGRVLDVFDRQSLWDDTMLLVCTDHGFLLGEHGWWGKSVQPWFDETIHTPLFIWDPRSGVSGERRRSLVQTVDIGPTLLDFFRIERTADMQGKPLAGIIADDTGGREAGLFGIFGGHVNVTDGRYVYMRACAGPANQPLFDYTLMPTHMRSRFDVAELRDAALAPPFGFTKGVPLLRVPGWTMGNPHIFGSLLFDLAEDPDQQSPFRDDELELRMARLMAGLMRDSDAPREQFERLGLPADGPVTEDHLLVEKQWERMQAARSRAVRRHEVPADAVVVTYSMDKLLAVEPTRTVLLQALPMMGHPLLARMLGAVAVIEAAAFMPDLDPKGLLALDARLREAITERGLFAEELDQPAPLGPQPLQP